MKTLVLLRHAKSSWAQPDLADIDRPLAKRGKRACRLLGAMLPPLLTPFDDEKGAVYCSPARRARVTLRRVLKSAGLRLHFTVEESLYAFACEPLWDWCRALPDEQRRVLLVGHNPALEELARRLGGWEALVLPTGAWVGLELAIERWAELAPGCGRLRSYLTPRALASG